MSRELNWVFDMNVELVNSTSYPTITRAILLYVKNQLVALGGWEVIGSSANLGAQWEYQGVTGGGVYGGSSTGPYDVWTVDTDIDRTTDGNNPGWAVLKGPTWEGSTPYLILAYEGQYDYNMYIGASVGKPSLVGGGPDYLPVAPTSETEFCEHRQTRWYRGYGQIRTNLSICTDNGSFFFITDTVGTGSLNGIMAFCRLDPLGRMTFATASGNSLDLAISLYTLYWKCGVPRPQAWGENVSPLIAPGDVAHFVEPMRQSATSVMSVDLNTVNCFGAVEPFPFYLTVIPETDNVEYKIGLLGRIPDMYIAPFGLSYADTAGEGGGVEYYACGYWLIPGDVAPVV